MQRQRGQAGRMRTSTRDLAELRDRMRAWLSRRLGSPVEVSPLSRPAGNGLSSETLIFDARRASPGDGRTMRCVARMAPASEAVPVFPSYDLGRQFEVMRLVGERTAIAVPRTMWFEPDPEPMGAPFLVMERLRGQVPPDMTPYTMAGWLLDASPADRERLQRSSVEILARLHETPFTARELRPFEPPGRDSSALRRHVDDQRAYYEWAHGSLRIPVLERAFDWLEEHWPDAPGPDVLNWGDARIGNVMYRDFTPVAVLDWEMAAVLPREADLGWMIFLHRFFQDVAEMMGLPGLPGFMRREDVCRAYREMTGHTPRDLDFYEMYAALRHGVIMARVWRRRIHFGEQPMPGDPDDLVLHRASIERMLDGARRRP
ncbi:aminoglycoside phosphotransferase (APT) family kinase protein [Streptosporangium becharense]|uniref:Aminoglycoside phosphotransferase (APT) family kinase protein n=1 Tax=Streptosporangium becharense TaxID=1816182 RepID=A0A7W9ICZ2_9ACTN|nr:phosphotransferase family protein [Streptosporangium becharense]MBB2911886.1 aminoglycoside phosphotransferase (APT) family kinase protein [Streptosporangium becharense]MBB5818433.1 aminoglycoside phosphotransferase (APT) family kinase protein [Streptosporangium becharense]